MSAKVKVLASGSSGNCILFQSNGRTIAIDVGIAWRDIVRGMGYDISSLSFALCSHSHGDHSKSIKECVKRGIQVYANKGVCDMGVGATLLPRVIKRDGFTIQNFGLEHNVENNAFVIDTEDGIRLLYVTDSIHIPKVVRGVNVAVIECNYDEDILLEDRLSGIVNHSRFDNHHSLNDCVEYLRRINSPSLQKIILWHPSKANLDEFKALERVKRELCIGEVYMASQGLEIDIIGEDF